MRRFSSYGPVSDKLHYYAPRKELIERAYLQLVGETPEEGGHYITVWAPRQTGKSWTMQRILWKLQALEQAARYGKELKLDKISLIFFVERVDDENRARLETDFLDPDTGVKVEPIFVETDA